MKYSLNCATKRILGISLLALVPVAGFAQDYPSVILDNGHINAKVYLPDADKGFYRSTRFDWAGVIAKLTVDGKVFHDQWFTRTDPAGRDFVYEGNDIVAGPPSSMMGLPEEFSSDGGALGYADAKTGETFIKIGVGVLKKPEEAKYDHYVHYEIVDGGKRTVKSTKTSVTFTQELMDKATGYGYLYTKTIRLVPNSKQLLLEHTLKNIGTKPIETRVYDHNFLTLNHQSPGPDFTITTKFPITPLRPVKPELGAVNGNVISYNKVLSGQENFSVAMSGFSDKPSDYDFLIQNKKENASFHIQGDHPVASASLWSMRATMAVEPYTKLSIPVGEQTEWKYTYTYGDYDGK